MVKGRMTGLSSVTGGTGRYYIGGDSSWARWVGYRYVVIPISERGFFTVNTLAFEVV
tara:strand:+ start:168 stop:338 length:171 start_codon:yes stop_codon:yes gene_type:complete